MTDTPLQRAAVRPLFGRKPITGTHPGLWLSRGLSQWKSDPTKRGEGFQAHVEKATDVEVSEVYKLAYQRWFNTLAASPHAAAWAGKLDGRLFIGTGGLSVLETHIGLSHTYGVPIIPGSAQKGLLQCYAKALRLESQAIEVLFGHAGKGDEPGDAGYVLFHDAWWVPGSSDRPLTPEVVTVHHRDYYESQGKKPATDFDSPNPNAQVAAQGAFLFSVECADESWANLALGLLRGALERFGIGGKTSAGYGRFIDFPPGNKTFETARQAAMDLKLPPEKRLRAEVERLTAKELANMFSKDKNKTREAKGDDWATFLELVKVIHNSLIQGWKDSEKGNEKKAYKFFFKSK